ncbi:flagellin N-terminal helical domain-containing protein [Rhizobium sp. C4]|uniref:flagellin N-terminal helical domain-containing protein n=1 Tax=Rhizobium sp. C4 TaxID=1349800 RepID=UPI001E5B84F2|nr:flagellin [Rhizobium sp. C4]MCD2173734.1 flagellar hook associated protein [Rhizobium sp. C4]
MAGVSYNGSAAGALALLTGSTQALEDQQRVMASGRKVDQASDNAAYWSISKAMKSTGMSMTAAADASELGAATADAASLGMNKATELVQDIQTKLIMAKAKGADKSALNSEITQLKEQLGTVMKSAGFSGQNWLSSGPAKPATTSLVASISTNKDGVTMVHGLDFDTSKVNLASSGNAADGLLTRDYAVTNKGGGSYNFHLLDVGSSTPAGGSEIALTNATSDDEINGMISAVGGMLNKMWAGASELGSVSGHLQGTSAVMQRLQDTLDISTGKLVDANMTKVAANMAAAKAAAQFSMIGLSIANQQGANSFALFR